MVVNLNLIDNPENHVFLGFMEDWKLDFCQI